MKFDRNFFTKFFTAAASRILFTGLLSESFSSKKNRRRIIMLLAGLCGAIGVTQGSGDGGAHWSYAGKEGPSNWGKLAGQYQLCARGNNQSPINILSTTPSKLFKLSFNYSPATLQILNNGHTIQFNYGQINKGPEHYVSIEKQPYPLPTAMQHTSSLTISGEPYKLLQIHFHSPSEHKVNGRAYPLEAHLVHANKRGQLAVVGVLFEQGEKNNFINSLWRHMPASAGAATTYESVVLNVRNLLPRNRGYFHYRGLLTTPPCSEGVRWFVMQSPRQVSASQVSKFKSVIGKNARPVQSVNNRFVLKSR